MDPFRCLILDDEPAGHQVLAHHIAGHKELEIIAHCHLAEEARSFLERGHIDILFLDIAMPKETGLELLASLERTPTTVIVSAYPEFALHAFDLGVRDYLVKPVSPERFKQAMDNVRGIVESTKQKQLSRPPSVLSFSTGFERKLINPRHVIAVESNGNFSELHMSSGKTLVSESLKAITKRLGPLGFVRVHKSWLVNVGEVDTMRTRVLVSSNGLEIPIGRAYKSVLHAFYHKHHV